MAVSNTKRMTDYTMKTTVYRMMLGGAIAAFVCLLGFSMFNNELFFVAGLMGGFVLLFVFLIIGVIKGSVSANQLKNRIRSLEAESSVGLDGETLRPLTQDRDLFLGNEWLVTMNGKKPVALTKKHITRVDEITPRREGMKKFWVRVTDDAGAEYCTFYKMTQPDPLQEISSWLQEGSAPEAIRPVIAKMGADGTCPYCGGPNNPDDTECQWCSKKMGEPLPASLQPKPAPAPAPAAPVYQEPAAAVRVSKPQKAAPVSKGTYITIGVLTAVLLVLIYLIFVR